MTERIYTSTEGGKLEPLEETPFSSEAELQTLIAAHPELLDGEQIRPGDARRWILITREKGIAASSGEGARWAVDHLIIDQDAIPTLVEVKRGTNSELRRSVVGQMLEYAAHASETWTADELRRVFDKQTRDRGAVPDEELAVLLQTGEEPDGEGFWDSVSRNLAAKRLRLLFVADEIPDPLAQVVAFLNAQMSHIEVLAVEIKRFQSESSRLLVPRIIGRSSASEARAPTLRLNRDSFLERFENEGVRCVATRLLDVAEQRNSYVYYGTSGVSIRVICSDWPRHLSVAWLYPYSAVGWMRTKEFSFGVATYDEDLPEKLRAVLDRWIDQFSADGFAEDVSGKGTKAWAVSHTAALEHQNLLVDRLSGVISEVTTM